MSVREPVVCFCFKDGITNIHVSTVSVNSSVIYIQGGGQKFLGHFKCHVRSQINLMASYLMNEAEICNKSEFYYSL